MKKIKEIKISSGCIGCGTCETICPDVFKVDSISELKKDTDLSQHLDCIKESADVCPVGAIEIEWEN